MLRHSGAHVQKYAARRVLASLALSDSIIARNEKCSLAALCCDVPVLACKSTLRAGFWQALPGNILSSLGAKDFDIMLPGGVISALPVLACHSTLRAGSQKALPENILSSLRMIVYLPESIFCVDGDVAIYGLQI